MRVSTLIVSLFLACLISVASAAGPGQRTGDAALAGRLQAIRARLPHFKRQLDKVRSGGQDIAYPLVTYTVLDRFTGYALDDLAGVRAPSAWGMTIVNGAKASSQLVQDAHTGRWAVRLVNQTPRHPNVYGMFECQDAVALKPGQRYTISVWCKSQNTAGAVIPVNAPWTERLALDATGGHWRRFSKTFVPTAADATFKPRVLVDDAGADLLIDDICLVQGNQPEAGQNLISDPSFEESWTEQRVAREINDMEAMTDRLKAQLDHAQSGAVRLPAVPRWDGSMRPTIDGPSFVGPVRIGASGKTVNRPIFFVGYGAFSQVRNDIEIFPAYGINIVQNGEIGPWSVYPAEGKTDDAAINELCHELDRAAKAGVAVDWLLSPHYVPEWVFAKYPNLRQQRADCIPFSIYSPPIREFLREFIHHVVARIKDKPALFSICLSNEPINCQVPDALSTAAWRQWLKARHGDIATLNARWNTSYASFDQIPQPNPLAASGEPRPGPAWCDFCRWNEQYFADFHKLLADAVHDVAPNIPVHAKATTWNLYRSDAARTGDDVALFDRITQIDGNDSVNLWSFGDCSGHSVERGDADFAQGWRENAIGYELERSTHNAPVFNSENHLIFDRESRYVAPAHVRSALWMGAIHGQSATTIWVWQRETSNPQSDFSGDIMERASCTEAVGDVCLDLNRVASEITALQKAPANVLILKGNTAAVWDGGRYDAAFLNLFTALSFTGLKPGFFTETQLEQHALPPAGSVLIIPDIAHLSDAAFDSLARFKGKVLFASASGGQLLTRDEYNQPRTAHLRASSLIDPLKLPSAWQALLADLRIRLGRLGVKPPVKVVSDNGSAQSQVQWQCVQTPQGIVINLYNASHDPATVTLTPPARAVDLLTGESHSSGARITLQPLEVHLLRL